MSIVATEVESIHGSTNRMIFYRCQDHLGTWHSFGPVKTSDPNFNIEAFKATVAAKIAAKLAEREAHQVIG